MRRLFSTPQTDAYFKKTRAHLKSKSKRHHKICPKNLWSQFTFLKDWQNLRSRYFGNISRLPNLVNKTTLTTAFASAYDHMLNDLRAKLYGKPISFIIDESPDVFSKPHVICFGQTPKNMFFLHSCYFNNGTKAVMYEEFIFGVIKKLNINIENVVSLCTDNANVMKCLFKKN